MKWRHTSGRILITFLGTYIPLIFLGICAVFGVFYSLSQNMQQEINQQYYNSTVKIQMQLDQALKTIRQRSYALKWDSRFAALSKEEAPLDATSIYSIYEVIGDLKSRSTLEGLTPSTTLLYFFNTNSIVSSNGRCTASSYYEDNVAKYGMTEEQWENLLANGTEGRFYSWTRQQNGMPKSVLFWAEPVTVARNTTLTVIALVDLNNLVRVQTESLLTSHDFALINQDGDFLYKTGSEIEDYPLEDFPTGSDMHRVQIISGDIAAVFRKMEMQDWICVSVVPLSVLYQNLRRVYPLMMGVTAGLILFGAAVIFYALKRNYRPIKRLQKLVSSQAAAGLGRNEYRIIESALVNMMDTNQKILDTMHYQEQVIRQNFLLELLVQGDMRVNPEQFSLCPMLDQGPVLLAGFFHTGTGAAEKAEEQLLELTRTEILSCSYVVPVESSIFCLLGLRSDRIPAKLMTVLGELLASFRQKTPGAYCTLSAPKDSWKGFPQAYNEVLVSGDLFAQIPPDRPVPYNQARKKIAQEYRRILSPALQKRFVGLLQVGDFEGAKALVGDFCLQLQGEEGLSLYIAKSRAFSLLNEAFHTLDTDETTSKLLREETDWLGNILCVSSFAGLRTALVDCVEIFRRISQEESQKTVDRPHTAQTVETIREYIDANFQNVDLNVSTIADEFHLSLSYLSKIFKEATGQGVLDYINSTRVEYAKKLLRESNQSIKAIAEASGFYNSNTFIRCLKKQEGVTPGQYREKTYGTKIDAP